MIEKNGIEKNGIELIKSEMDIPLILAEAKSHKYKLDDSGTLMAVPPSKDIAIFHGWSYITSAIFEIQRLRGFPAVYAMINNLPAGIKVPIHTDTLVGTKNQPDKPKLERWHLPLQTNDKCFWWDEKNGEKHFSLGYWFGPLHYWINHCIYNYGDTDRYHLIVDIDVLA